jgi:hypothetical protein
MLHNDYDRESLVTKQNSLVVSLKGSGASGRSDWRLIASRKEALDLTESVQWVVMTLRL